MDSVMSKKREVVPSELLSKEFLSQFKTEADVSKFLKELHSQVLEQMLQGEMDSHLGYEKHSADGNNTGNSRNGLFPKKIQTEYGDSVIRIPRDRRSEFEPVVISQAPESRIVYREVGHLALRQRNERIGYRRRASRYLWGITSRLSAISIITNKVTQAAADWQNRPLESLYMVCLMARDRI